MSHRISPWLVFSSLLFIVISAYSQSVNATAAFARSTGATCNKCHTANFPRLTPKGERFMMNGFQIKKKSESEFSLGDDVSESEKKNKVELPKIGDILSITGQINPVELNSNQETPKLANPETLSFVVTAHLDKNTPIWAGIDFTDEGASVHRYQLSRTNIADSSLLNFRLGTLDPTTWTSFYGHAAALQSASEGIGSYGNGHGENTGFVTVGSGYAERNAVEYYGYNQNWLWSLGFSNDSGGHAHDDETPANGADKLDAWFTTRLSLAKNSSVSLLWYDANGSQDSQTITVAGNLRAGNLDLLSQFSIDNTGGRRETEDGNKKFKDKWGLTVQANYTLSKSAMFITRYDATDNGESNHSKESQLTMALVLKPKQNIKVTASYVMELTSVAGTTAGDGHNHSHGKPGISGRAAGHDEPSEIESEKFGDHFLVNIRYMF